MLSRKIYVPSALDMPNALRFSLKLNSTEQAERFIFDFSEVGHIEPFGMLIVSSEIRHLLRRFPEAIPVFEKYEHMTYGAHMGLFRAMGLDFGKLPGQAKGGARYLPLSIFNCVDLRDQAIAKAVEVGDVVEAESKQLSQMLCGEDQGAVFDTLAYSLREMIRNVVEHSEAEQFGLCGQYWPTKNRAEFAIVDRGIGLMASLRTNPHIDASDHKKAINYALMPAVSGKAFKGAKKSNKGHWGNSGFGLYMTSRICRNGGNFFVLSGDTGMMLTTKAKKYFPGHLQGTAIRLVVKTDQLATLRNTLETYRKEGLEIQSRYREIVSIDPSSASLMLSEDFDLNLWERLLVNLRSSPNS
jgi:hypothetical protein